MLQLKPNLRATYLPIHPVLRQGYIIHARSYGDGSRTVSFENPAIYFEFHPSIQSSRNNQMIILGKGQHVQNALNEALASYYKNTNKTLINKVENVKPVYKKALIGKLDIWLGNHKGSLRAVCDFDGTVLVKLESLSNPMDLRSQRVTLEGSGSTFYGALAAALSTYRKYDPNIRHISIQNA